MGQGLKSCNCPAPRHSAFTGGKGTREAISATTLPYEGSYCGAAKWAPPNAALMSEAGAVVPGRLAGSKGTSWVAARGCATRLSWSSSADHFGLRTSPVVVPDVFKVPARVVQVAAGEAHALILALDPWPRLFSCGANTHGQLGVGDTNPRPDVAKACELGEFHASGHIGGIACGGQVSFAISQRGDMWAWGKNEESGVLGLGSLPADAVSTPMPVSSLQRRVRCIQAATTGLATFCLSHLGGTISWGSGASAVHGHGHQLDEPPAKALKSLANVQVVQVAPGLLHVLALSAGGEVYTWGRSAGAFGDEGSLQLFPRIVDTLTPIRIVQVAAGGGHSLALSAAGEVYGWGAHVNGELSGASALGQHPRRFALPHQLELGLAEVREIGCGHCHSLFLAARAKGEEAGEKGSDLWICGHGALVAPGTADTREQHDISLQNHAIQKPFGVPLKLTRVNIKRVLEVMT